MPALLDRAKTIAPSPADSEGASRLAHILEGSESTQKAFGEIPVPENVRLALVHVLHEMGKGHAFAIMAMDEELTPQQAAGLLKVSRAHFMRAIQLKTIPYRRVGSHYRVRLQDVLRYREEREQRGKMLDELTAQAQDLDMEY